MIANRSGCAFTAAGVFCSCRSAKRDGPLWAPPCPGRRTCVVALAVSGTDLYAGGDFTTAGGTSASRIAKWNGTSWAALGTGMDSSVVTLTASSASVVEGGSITYTATVSNPVTGSAHCTLVPYWAARLGKETLHARQVSRRGGELFCTLAGERVLVAGEAVTFFEGTIELPR